MELRERLEIRRLAHERYWGESIELQFLADRFGADDVLDWLQRGLPTPTLDVR